MRILTVGNMYPPSYVGGYELIWQSAVAHLRASGHLVRVLTTDLRARGVRSPDEEGLVHRELRWYWRDHTFPPLSIRARLRLERHNAAVLDRHLSELSPDVVCWWAMGGMSLSLIERVRRAGHAAAGVVCDDWMLYGPKVDAWLRIFTHRLRLAAVVERATAIPTRVDLGGAGPWLFLSDTVRRRALDGGWELPQTEVSHRGIDREAFQPSPSHPWRWRLLYHGRIDPRKGIDTAMLALPLLPEEATLTINGVGDDQHLKELERLADARGLHSRVTFSRAPRDALPALYAAADALLFPVRWEEPWGLVPLEAMAIGTPVIATGKGGSGEYLRDGQNCLLFDAESGAEGLASAVGRLAHDPGLRARLRENGFETAARFSEESFNLAVERMLERAAPGGSR
jgi:glycogen synthase